MNTTDRRLRAVLVSNSTDALGTQLLSLVLDLLAVAALGFTATQVGLLNAFGTISYLLLAIPLGALVDARGPYRSVLASLVVKIALCVTTLALWHTHQLGVLTTMGIALAFGIVTLLTETAQTSLAAHLTDESAAVTRTVARMASADRAAAIACPAVAGFAVAHHASTPANTAAAVLLTLAVAALLRLPHAPTPTPADAEDPEHAGTRKGGLAHGFRIIWANHTLLGVTLLVTAGNIGLALGDSVSPILVMRHLGLSPNFYGLMGTASAAAGLAASALAPRIVTRQRLRTVFAVGGLAQALVACLPLTAALAPQTAQVVLLVFSAAWALVMTVCNIAGASYVASVVPRASLGRASAASRTITMGAIPIAALAGGLMTDHWSIHVPLVAWPLITACAALTFTALTRRHA